jgi:hypothetical protein
VKNFRVRKVSGGEEVKLSSYMGSDYVIQHCSYDILEVEEPVDTRVPER